MTDRIRSILQQLEQTREDLLALSDDIWLSIDHNDNTALQEGVAFKQKYNEKMLAFDQLAEELSALVQQFTQVRPDEATPTPTPNGKERIIRDLSQREPHSIDADFTFKRPYGFRLDDEVQAEVTTWRRLYELFCLYLRRRDSDCFARLPDYPHLVSRRGNPSFSRDPQLLRSAMALPTGIYAEVNLSANHLRDQIKILLDIFGIERHALTIYLRQDRDAG